MSAAVGRVRAAHIIKRGTFMLKSRRTIVLCFAAATLAAWSAAAARAEYPKTGFDQGGVADGALEMVRSSVDASAARFQAVIGNRRSSPGINLSTLKNRGNSLMATFRDSRAGSSDQAGEDVIIQAELSSTGPTGVVQVTREIKLNKSESYDIDFSSLGIGQEVHIRHRYKSVSRAPRFIPAHDYSTCNGPSCFSCTHETKCVEKTVKVCLKINPVTLQCEYTHEKTWECNPGPGHVCSPK